MKEKEVGIMVKEKKEGGLELHLFPSKEAMARFEISLQYEYAKVSEDKADTAKPALTEVLEALWAAAQGEE